MGPNFRAGGHPLGKRQTYYLLERGGLAKCAKGIQKAHFSRRQELTHPSAHEEKHAEQEKTTTLHSLMPAPAFGGRVSTTSLSPYYAC